MTTKDQLKQVIYDQIPENYKVIEKLGSGESGFVLKCRKSGTDTDVALKIPKENRLNTLRHEALMFRTLMENELNNDNIVQFHGEISSITKQGEATLSLEFEHLDFSLMDYFLLDTPMTLNEVRTVIRQLAAALQDLRRVGMIHADVQPQNILFVDFVNEPFNVKLVDFGSAVFSRLVKAGQIHQPLEYRAPEVVLQLPFTEAADIWSLGCVMAEILLGEPIFPASDEFELLRSMIGILGPVPDHLIEASLHPKMFFKRVSDSWVLKSTKELFGWQKQYEDKQCHELNSLDEMKTQSQEKMSALEAYERSQCIELLKGMMQWDAQKRFTTDVIMSHPFITQQYQFTEDVKQEFVKSIIPDSYEITKILGSGSFGMVVKCLKPDSDKEIAMKLARQKDTGSLRHEALIAQDIIDFKLDTKNIIKYYGSGFNNGFLNLEMEALDIDIYSYLKQGHHLQLADVRAIIGQLAVALEALKRIGIVHFDVKLDNIMFIDRVNKPLKVKLIDFGLASYARIMTKGTICQPLSYRAPEIILGLLFSEAIDIWSLGCIMIEMTIEKCLIPAIDQYQALSFLTEFLGPPPQHLINASHDPTQYFNWDGDLWVLKTPGEFYFSTDNRKDPRNYNFRSLEELKMFMMDKYETNPDDVSDFIDLLKGMLQWDERIRFTPTEIQRQPFIAKGFSKDIEHPSNGTSNEDILSDTKPDATSERCDLHKDSSQLIELDQPDQEPLHHNKMDQPVEDSSLGNREVVTKVKCKKPSSSWSSPLNDPKPPIAQTKPQRKRSTKSKKSRAQRFTSWLSIKLRSFSTPSR